MHMHHHEHDHAYSSTFLHKTIILALVVLPLLTTGLAMWYLWNSYFFISDLVLLVVMYCLTGLGVTVGYHRMLTHSGFESPRWVKGMFTILGAMAFEGQPLSWVATHHCHHAHSDEEGDPHSPLDGFWHSHLGWLFSRKNFKDPHVYCPELAKDPMIKFIDKYTVVWMALSLLIPYAIGGLTGLIWGGGVRIFLLNHVTWSVNSICHTFGSRPFETTDESRNNWVIGLLGFGEGWHNNHHAFPQNAFHGMRWWQFDMSGIIIRFMEMTGLIWNVKRVSHEAEAAHATRSESMKIVVDELKTTLLASISKAKDAAEEMVPELSKLPPEEIQSYQQFKTDSVKRMNEIQHFATSVSMMKRHKANQYIKEVQDIAAEIQQKGSSMLKRAKA